MLIDRTWRCPRIRDLESTNVIRGSSQFEGSVMFVRSVRQLYVGEKRM